MKLKVTKIQDAALSPKAARCPHCGREAVFTQVGKDVSINSEVICGQRRCPDPDCSGHLFIVARQGRIEKAYPPIRIDFNAEEIPDAIRRTFEEALDCHAAGCLVASAIMVRRTMEEICAERGAQGKTLKDRMKDLESRIVVPRELSDAMDELRLLGNDAAHVEAKTFNRISNDEVEVAIEFCKEILKALYQYSFLLAKLRGLKNAGSP